MAVSAAPVYFELSWAVLSSFSLLNVFAGFLIVGITGCTRLWAVPVSCSASSAIANGLCYIAYYSAAPLRTRVSAAALADVFWCLQEAGLCFYSYVILRRFLRRRKRWIHLYLFWFLMTAVLALRMAILVTRAYELANGTKSRQALINRLHTGYFGSIALVEVMSSFFLLDVFIEGKQSSIFLSQDGNLFRHVIVSTKIRVFVLALIGMGRAITYSFQSQAQSATGAATQLDRFLAILENYFPIVMFFDLLATRLVSSEYTGHLSCQSKCEEPRDSAIQVSRINKAYQADTCQDFVMVVSPPPTVGRPFGECNDKRVQKTIVVNTNREDDQV